jgi:predicted nucleotidyltransferase component of viral defense system
MDRIAFASASERKKLFIDASDKISLTDFIVEKDFWVSWVLDKIFNDGSLSKILRFKGGTSLSKAFRLIERFSEDIDLILSRDAILKDAENLEQPSNSRQMKFNKIIEERAAGYIATELKDRISAALGAVCAVYADAEDGHILYVKFPGLFDYRYVNPDIKLEIGPLALWNPNDRYPIHSYVEDAYPELQIKPPLIPTVKAERTFWEKITSLHHEHYRPLNSPLQPRYSRHYYDIFKMGRSGIKDQALENLNLLDEVVSFKKRFYPRGWARYGEARRGTLRLYPAEHNLAALKKDYLEMANMIFGDIPAWEEILECLRQLENEINSI